MEDNRFAKVIDSFLAKKTDTLIISLEFPKEIIPKVGMILKGVENDWEIVGVVFNNRKIQPNIWDCKVKAIHQGLKKETLLSIY
jgi:hypothetical protein